MKQTHIALALFALFAGLTGQALATPAITGPVNLGTACGYAILAGSAITNNADGVSVLDGNVATYPTQAENNMSKSFTTLNGTDYTDNTTVAAAAKADLLTAYNSAITQSATTLTSPELGGTTLTAGVYTTGAATLSTGTLRLDAQNVSTAVFIIYATSTFISSANTSVTLANGALAQNVFFIVGSSATFNSPTTLQGTVIANTSITVVGMNSSFTGGGLLAIGGAVTFDTDPISSSVLCAASGSATPTYSPSAASATPTDSPSAGSATPTESPSTTGSATPNDSPTVSPSPSNSPTPGPVAIDLGSATGFSLLAGSGGITNSYGGVSTTSSASGYVGSSGTETDAGLNENCTDFGSGPATTAALNALNAAYNVALNDQGPPTLVGTDLANQTLTEGVYAMASGTLNMSASTTLVLDGAGNTNSVFIFQATTGAMNIGASDTISLVNGARAKNVFWVVGGAAAATLGASDIFVGTIMAQTINVGADTSVDGALLAMSTLSLNQDTVNTPSKVPCDQITVTGTFTSSPNVSATESFTVTGTPTNTPIDTPTQSPTVSPTFTESPVDSPSVSPTLSSTSIPAYSPATIPMGSAAPFSIYATSGIMNSGASSANGSVGSNPTQGSYSPGLNESCTDLSSNTTAMTNAKNDLTTAFNDTMAATGSPTISTSNISAVTVVPGVYNAPSGLIISGNVILDGGGNANAVFIFQVVSLLTVENSTVITLINGAKPWNVFWACGSGATIGTDCEFVGTIMAVSNITVNTGTTINGRLLAGEGGAGSVTLASDTITTPSKDVCGNSPTPSLTFTQSETATQTSTNVVPTATQTGTLVVSTATQTGTLVVPTATQTGTLVVPTATQTGTDVVPTATQTGTDVVPVATATNTPVASATPSPTYTPTTLHTSTPVPTSSLHRSTHSYFYPSPSRNNRGAIAYNMKEPGNVTIRIYNQAAQLVDTITDAMPTGWQSSNVSVEKFAPGIYYYVLSMQYTSGPSETDAPRGFVVLH